MQILFFIAFGIMVFCGVGLLAAPFFMRSNRQVQRMLEAVEGNRMELQGSQWFDRFLDGIVKLTHDVRTRLGLSISPKSIDRLAAAGYRGVNAPDYFFAAQCLTPLAGAFAASFIPVDTMFWVFVFATLGYLFPGIWLTESARRRRERISRSLPDVVDLLVICVDGGLGLDQALLRVNKEIADGHPEMQSELMRVHLEQKAGRPRMETWQNLADRIKVREITVFVGMLTQAERFGTPIAKALSTFADDLRIRRRQHVEELSEKTKVKIIFPPCLLYLPLPVHRAPRSRNSADHGRFKKSCSLIMPFVRGNNGQSTTQSSIRRKETHYGNRHYGSRRRRRSGRHRSGHHHLSPQPSFRLIGSDSPERNSMRVIAVRNEVTGESIGKQVQVANTSFTRMRGLLGRRHLAADEGLWIKPSSGVHTFGMKFAIDVIGLDRKHRVVRLWNALVPNRITSVSLKISSVLELPAGKIAESGTEIGHTLEMDALN